MFSLGCIFGLLCVSLAAVSADPEAKGCRNITLKNPMGDLFIQGNSSTKYTCCKFTLPKVTTAAFFNLRPGEASVSSIIVQNVNGTGHAVNISSRSFTADGRYDDYIAVGYGVPVKNGKPKKDSVVVFVFWTEAVTTNVTVGSYNTNHTSCILQLTDLAAEVVSPDYQQGLAMKFKCTYNFTLSQQEEEARPAHTLTFTKFSATRAMIGYTKDKLEQFRGDLLPHDFKLEDNLQIRMNFDAAAKDVFAAAVIATSRECTEMMSVKAGIQQILSPNYPAKYTDNLNCKYILTSAVKNQRIQLQLSSVDLAQDGDHVNVIDGGASRNIDSRLLAYLSAMNSYKDSDAVMVSSGDSLIINFVTDELGTAKGFSFNVTLTDVNELFLVPSVVKFSPSSSLSGDAELLMLSPQNTRVVLMPGSAVLASADASVRCHDGPNTKYPLLSSYRAGLTMFPAYSTTNRMLCVASGFSDVFNVTNDSFNASTTRTTEHSLSKFSVGVSDSYTLDVAVDEAGEIAEVTYDWIIQPDQLPDSVIELTISKLSIPSHSPNYNVTVQVSSLTEETYAIVTEATTLPYIMRVAKSTALRLSVKVSTNVTAGASSKSALSLAASYSLDNSTVHLSESSGVLKSPHYPQGTPQGTIKHWLISVPAGKSLQLSYNPMFELTGTSNLRVFNLVDTNVTYSEVSGPTQTAPSDLIVNNTIVNDSLSIGVYLETAEQSRRSGVSINYTVLDGGYTSPLNGFTQTIKTPGYPNALTSSYSASWVISVDKKTKKGALQMIFADVTFHPSNLTSLELRDGPDANSPVLLASDRFSDRGQETVLKSHFVNTSSNFLYIGYTFEEDENNSTGSALSVLLQTIVCSNTFQCKVKSDVMVCYPFKWRCDGLYQCLDGKDELNCSPAPTTKTPAVTKKGAAWWVVAVCMIAGVVIGIICSVIVITVIMRRRGAGYNRLNELMTPVPT